jgi:hypothetical protein
VVDRCRSKQNAWAMGLDPQIEPKYDGLTAFRNPNDDNSTLAHFSPFRVQSTRRVLFCGTSITFKLSHNSA